jgi:hypothetical protein
MTLLEAEVEGSYLEQVDGELRHYLRVSAGELCEVIYPEQASPERAEAEHRARYKDRQLPFRVFTPPQRTDRLSYREWHFDPSGALEQIVGRETGPGPDDRKEYEWDPSGALMSTRVWVHDEDGNLIEVVTYDANGRVISRDDLP